MLSSYFSYWRGSRADLLEFLTPSSKELDDLHLSFLRAFENIYMANFFETVPMHLFGLPLYLASLSLNIPLTCEPFCTDADVRTTRLTLKLCPQVVTKESATIDGKPSISVDADHRSLQRCEDPFTGNYLQIVHQINLIVETLNKKSKVLHPSLIHKH